MEIRSGARQGHGVQEILAEPWTPQGAAGSSAPRLLLPLAQDLILPGVGGAAFPIKRPPRLRRNLCPVDLGPRSHCCRAGSLTRPQIRLPRMPRLPSQAGSLDSVSRSCGSLTRPLLPLTPSHSLSLSLSRSLALSLSLSLTRSLSACTHHMMHVRTYNGEDHTCDSEMRSRRGVFASPPLCAATARTPDPETLHVDKLY